MVKFNSDDTSPLVMSVITDQTTNHRHVYIYIYIYGDNEPVTRIWYFRIRIPDMIRYRSMATLRMSMFKHVGDW
jgi:hypothetical protein